MRSTKLRLDFYGSDVGNERIEARSSSGGAQDNGLLEVTTGGTPTATTATTSLVGLHTRQIALGNGDQEYWIDGASQGTLAATLPTDIDTVMLGDYPGVARNRDGIHKRIAFYDGRKGYALRYIGNG